MLNMIDVVMKQGTVLVGSSETQLVGLDMEECKGQEQLGSIVERRNMGVEVEKDLRNCLVLLL